VTPGKKSRRLKVSNWRGDTTLISSVCLVNRCEKKSKVGGGTVATGQEFRRRIPSMRELQRAKEKAEKAKGKGGHYLNALKELPDGICA